MEKINKNKKQKQTNWRDCTASEAARAAEEKHLDDSPRVSFGRRGTPPRPDKRKEGYSAVGRKPTTLSTSTALDDKPSTSRGKLQLKEKTPRTPITSAHSVKTTERKEGDKKGEGVEKQGAKRKRNLELPAIGEPGGMDDPLRRGLSGSGVKWYLRYLQNGMEPKVAREKAEEHRASHQPDQKRKRGNDTITPPQRPDNKRAKYAKKTPEGNTTKTMAPAGAGQKRGVSYASALKGVRVAVMAKEYPKQLLSPGDLTKLEEAIIKEVAKGWSAPLVFEGIHFKPGMLLIDCSDEATSKWLQGAVTKLQWSGVELKACTGTNIPGIHKITVFLPRSAGQEMDDILALIRAQNKGVNTELWGVTNSREEGPGKLVVAAVDEESINAIKENGFLLNYRFGKVKVHTGKGSPEKEEEKAREAESAGTEKIPTSQELIEGIDLDLLDVAEDELPLSEEEDRPKGMSISSNP